MGSQDISKAHELNAACRTLRVPFTCSFSAGFLGAYFVDCGDEWLYKTSVKKESTAIDEAEETKENEDDKGMVSCHFSSLRDLLAKKHELKDLNLFILSQLSEVKQDKRQKSEEEIDMFVNLILEQTKGIQFSRRQRKGQDALIKEF